MRSRLNTLVVPVLVLSGLFLFLLLTNPFNIPIIGLLVPFFAIGVLLFLVIKTMALAVSSRSEVATLIAAPVAFIVVFLLLLSSLHQLTWQDILLAITFASLLTWYVGRLQLKR